MSDDKDLLQKLKANFEISLNHQVWNRFIENATSDFEFREGTQWTAAEKKELEDRGQAATVENEIMPRVDRINGQYKKQKTRIIYRGRNVAPLYKTPENQQVSLVSDEQRMNVWSDLALHIQQQNGYEFEEGDMFDDGQVCGFGCLEIDIKFDESLQPEIQIKHEDCLDMYPDPNSRRYNWNEDAEFISKAKWMAYAKAKETWPEKAKALRAYINENPVTNDAQGVQGYNVYIDHNTERLRIIEQEYKTYKKKKVAFLDTGPVDITDFNKTKLSKFKTEFPDAQILENVYPIIKTAVFCGDVLLEHKERTHKHNMFKWVPFFVHRKKNGEPYSKVRMLKDPQMEVNKRRSKALHLLMTNQAMFEEGAARNVDELRKEMAKPDGIIEYRQGYKFEMVKNVEVAATQMEMQAESKIAISRISGISDESMALHSEVRSGIGIQRKQMMTDLIVLPIFDNLRRTRLIVGKIMFELMRQYYTEEKIFSVTDDMNRARQVHLTREDIEIAKDVIYDLVIEEAPDTTTIQDEQFRLIVELLKGLNLPPNYSMALLPVAVQLSQLRNKEEIMKQIMGLSQPGPEYPKASLNFVWSEMTPEQQVAMANSYKMPELAQAAAQAPARPAHQTKELAGIEKVQIKADTDLMTTAIKEKGKKESEGNSSKSQGHSKS